MDKVVHHPEIGKIHLKKVPSSSSIKITVHPRRGVVVSIPWLVRYPVAMRFIEQKKEWILRMIERQSRKIEQDQIHGKSIPPLGDGVVIKTLKRIITIEQSPELVLFQNTISVDNQYKVTSSKHNTVQTNAPIVSVSVKKDSATIIFPADFPTTPQKDSVESGMLNNALIKILKQEAKEVLPQKLEQLAAKHNFEYNKLALKNNLTNWGSCSEKKNINLNIHLVRLPEELIDYVILHELCHLKYQNHGANYYKLLDSICEGREKELRKELKSYKLY